MRIAVLFRGPMRPSPAHTRRYVAEFIRNFEELGIDPDTYLATWRPDRVDDDVAALIGSEVRNVIALAVPSDEFIGGDVCQATVPSGHRGRSMFYQHYMAKIAIDLIANNNDYDLIVHTRTDLRVLFGGMLPKWLEDDRRGFYQTTQIRQPELPGSHVNDQFSIATPGMMQKAWNYGSLSNLRAKILQVASAGGKAEDVLQHLLDDAGVSPIAGPFEAFGLDEQRHSAGL